MKTSDVASSIFRRDLLAPSEVQDRRAVPLRCLRRTACPLRKGVSLVELLIVVGIIALLVQLLLPAVNASREAARRTQCDDNLRQIGLAAHTHLGAHDHLPSGGWGFRWFGEPERGYGRRQPGSWVYNLLPFVEQAELRDFGDKSRVVQRSKGAALAATPLALFTCPSRRDVVPHQFVAGLDFVNIDLPRAAGRSDYAGNMGSLPPTDQPGPESLAEGDRWSLGEDQGEYTNSETGEPFWSSSKHNGVIFQRSTIKPRHIEDGMTHTYLVGEKFIHTGDYRSGSSWGDDQNMYTGHDKDMARSAHLLHAPLRDKPGPEVQLPQDHPRAYYWSFGSAHAESLSFAMCGGAVRRVSYGIEPRVHARLGDRADGELDGVD